MRGHHAPHHPVLPRRGRASACLGLLGAALLSACAGGRGPQPAAGDAQGPAYYQVTAKRAAIYFFSPAQPAGPDTGVAKGETVEMLRRESGFSRVRTPSGTEGYIANDQIAPLPEPPPAPQSAMAFRPVPDQAAPGRLKVLPLDQMISPPPVEPPLPTAAAESSPTP